MSYASLSYARDQGITTGQADDTRLQRLLDEASRRIDRVTGWWFEARTLTLPFDGQGTECLWLPAPVVSLTSVSIDGVALTLGDVLVYGSTAAPRQSLRAPRLARKNGVRWPQGRKNVSVVGSFGFVESDGTTPTEIRDVCVRLAVRELGLITDAAAQGERQRGRVFRETTDGHSYELAGVLPGAVGAWRQGGLTGDPDIDVTLAAFRRPSQGARV